MAAPTMPPDGSAVGLVYRMSQKTDRSLDGLPLLAAPFPCAITSESGKVGCCYDSMPTTLTMTITNASGVDTDYTLTYGEWYGGGVFFWQYVAPSEPVAYTLAYQIDFYCYNPHGVYADFEAVIYFGDSSGSNTRFVFDTVYCCNPSSGGTPFLFRGTFPPPVDTEAAVVTPSSGSTWEATVTYECGTSDPVPDQNYWLGLNTGRTLDGLPLYAAADCISDTGAAAGSTSHPFNMITESTGTAKTLFRLADTTGKILDGLPLYAGENDPCCDGGFIDHSGGGGGGGGGSVNTSCCSSPLPSTLYVTMGGAFSGLGTVAVTYAGEFAFQSDTTTGPPNYPTWSAEVGGVCSITKIIIQCTGLWALTIINSYISTPETSFSDPGATCDPLLVTFTSRVSIYTSCGASTWSATITE